MSKIRYIDELLLGEAFLDEIDDYIEEWHASDTDEKIYEYLGMTEEEYGLWLEDDSTLKLIVFSRMHSVPLKDLVEEKKQLGMVARSANPEQSREISDWMKKTGRISDED